MTKLEIANTVLKSFAPDAEITFVPRVGYKVSHSGKKAKRWVTIGGSFYPTCRWNRGGTATIALTQLIRWLQNRPVLPLTSWKYWCNQKLVEPEILEILKEAGYPETAKCCLCDEELVKGLDWWNLGKVQGCCCTMFSGCRQNRSTVVIKTDAWASRTQTFKFLRKRFKYNIWQNPC